MKDGIKEIVVDNGELIAYYKDGSFQAFDTLLQEVLDYITNLQKENNNLKEDFKRHIDRINELTERSDNLQEENERLCSEIDRLNKEYERIYNENCKLRENHNINDITLLDENERLKELCDKYEEEHNTTFQEWLKELKGGEK